MKKMTVSLALSGFLYLTGTAANAENILYFKDDVAGTDQMAAALSSLPATDTVTIAGSSNDFATKIATGNYGLGILFVQGYSSNDYADAILALGTFVNGGGRAIYTDWSRNNTYAALFGATWTGVYNQSTVTVTDPTLATNITNPIGLTNPGWGIFSMDVAGVYTAATFGDLGGAIVINGSSIVNGFLSDTGGSQLKQLYLNEINYASSAVPEPTTLFLFGTGLVCLATVRRNKKA